MSNLHYDQFKQKEGGGREGQEEKGGRSESTTKEGCDHLTYGLQCVTQLAVRRGGERERERERVREVRGERGVVLERNERMRGRVCPFDLWS